MIETSWWTLALLGMAAFRVYRLIAMDTLLDTIRARFVGLHGWREGQIVPKTYRQGAAEFLICPWCLGFWVALAWWGAWQIWPHGTLIVAAPLAISTIVGFLGQINKE